MPNDRDRETLDAFQARFGELRARFEQQTVPGMNQEPLPMVQQPQDRRDQAGAEQAEQPRDIWPDAKVQPDFAQAAAGEERLPDAQGVDSRQVAEDGPEHDLPPPEDAEDQDRITHAERMAQDDAQARGAMKDSYFADLEARLKEAEQDRAASGQEQGRDQEQGYER